MVMPRAGPPARIRGFVAMVLLGVLANALVCGGISQPAERYGARVIFLLPMMLVVLLAYMPFWRRERVPVAG
jgi:formate/nitrite transporter FocA (FNT family)